MRLSRGQRRFGSTVPRPVLIIPFSPRRCGGFSITWSGAERRLNAFYCSVRVASFTVEFWTLAVESGWNEEALQGVFLNALGSDVKDELTSREESSDLEHLITLAIRVDNRLRERRRERALRFHATSSISASSFGLFSTAPRAEASFGVRAHADRTHAPLPRGEGAPDSLPSLPLLWSDGPLPVWMSLSTGKRAGSPVTRGILVSRALDPSVSRPLLCATLLWQDQTAPLTILLDSSADESFIDRELVHQLGIDTVPLDSPIETQALDGRPLARVERRTVPVNLLVSGNHHESILLRVISSPLSPVVLGYPWLKTHNPQIDWATGRVISWSTHCLSHCSSGVGARFH